VSRPLTIIGDRAILVQEFENGGWLVTHIWMAHDTGEHCDYSEACTTFEEMQAKMQEWLGVERWDDGD